MEQYLPLFPKQPECRASDRSRRVRTGNIPYSEGDLCTQRQIAVPDGEGNPFIPSGGVLAKGAGAENHSGYRYMFLKDFCAVRNGIVRGLLSATSWQMTYRSDNALCMFQKHIIG